MEVIGLLGMEVIELMGMQTGTETGMMTQVPGLDYLRMYAYSEGSC